MYCGFNDEDISEDGSERSEGSDLGYESSAASSAASPASQAPLQQSMNDARGATGAETGPATQSKKEGQDVLQRYADDTGFLGSDPRVQKFVNPNKQAVDWLNLAFPACCPCCCGCICCGGCRIAPADSLTDTTTLTLPSTVADQCGICNECCAAYPRCKYDDHECYVGSWFYGSLCILGYCPSIPAYFAAKLCCHTTFTTAMICAGSCVPCAANCWEPCLKQAGYEEPCAPCAPCVPEICDKWLERCGITQVPQTVQPCTTWDASRELCCPSQTDASICPCFKQ
jgi:hypothetical protein